MTGVYSFRPGPTYRGATRQELFDAAMAEPLSATSTFFDQAKGGILESFGIGTVLRDNLLPSEAPTEPGLVLRTEDGQRVDLPDTPAMRRRRAAFGDLAGDIRPETPQEFEARRDEAGALTEDQYKASPSFRANIPWDAGMTKARAEALAAMDDAKRVREFYAEKRPISAFLGNLTGQALDPINYVPVAGPLVKAAAVARFGKIGGAALHSALDAAGNTAVFGVATADQRAKFGDDVSWQATISQIATAALIGGAFGTVAGAMGKRVDARAVREADQRLATLKTTQEARIALNEGIDALVRGEDVNLSPNATEPIRRVAQQTASIAEQPVIKSQLPPVETPEFKEWFGTSKIVDDDGSPLVVYHGTGSDFDAFRIDATGSAMDAGKLGRGFYFTTRPEIASSYANATAGTGGTPNVMPVYLSVQNPLVFDAAKPGSIWDKLRSQSKEWGIELDPVTDEVTAAPNDAWAFAFSEVAQEKGFDGVILKFPRGAGDEVVVFNPTQIKSRFNTGAFSKADARIIDTSQARPEPLPEGRAQAETRIAKSDDGKSLADQYRVDPQTGAFAEEGEIAQLQAEGRLTEEDAATLAAAQADFETGAAYAEALKSVAGCLI